MASFTRDDQDARPHRSRIRTERVIADNRPGISTRVEVFGNLDGGDGGSDGGGLAASDRISGSTNFLERPVSPYFTDEGGRLKIPYGSMFENSAGTPTAITLTTAGTWYGWVSAGDDITYGVPYISFSGNATADRLLIGSDGDGVWQVNVSVDGDQGAAQAHLLTAAIFINDAQDLSLTGSTQYTATQQVQPIPISGFVKVNAGDYLDLRFKSDTNSRAFELYHCNVSMKRVCYQ
jgi:hypothetical protein